MSTGWRNKLCRPAIHLTFLEEASSPWEIQHMPRAAGMSPAARALVEHHPGPGRAPRDDPRPPGARQRLGGPHQAGSPAPDLAFRPKRLLFTGGRSAARPEYDLKTLLKGGE